MLHVDKQGTPTLKALNLLDGEVVQSGYSSARVLETRRDLNSVITWVGGLTHVLCVLSLVSNVEVSI